jgi:hypothetical protein
MPERQAGCAGRCKELCLRGEVKARLNLENGQLCVVNTPNRKWPMVGLCSGAIIVLAASFHPDILRDGNEWIATFLAALGLLGIGFFLGLNGRQTVTNTARRTKMPVALEYLTIAALFGLGWTWRESDSFFAEGPSGSDLIWLNSIILAALTAIAVCSIVIRKSVGDVEVPALSGRRMWAAMGSATAVLVCLNLQTRADEISVEGRGRIVVESQGFPFAARRSVRFEMASKREEGPDVIVMQNGARVVRTEQKTVVMRFRKTVELPPTKQVTFRDGSAILFEAPNVRFTVPHVAPIEADFANHRAQFVSLGAVYWDWHAVVANGLATILLAAHSGSVAARRQPRTSAK